MSAWPSPQNPVGHPGAPSAFIRLVPLAAPVAMSMDPVLAKMLDLKFFHENGYVRKTCPTCKDPYWTTDKARELCGDSNCVEYDFLGNPLTKKPLSVAEMRKAFQRFFESKGHAIVPRQSVVARWRDDIYLNIASIANYQPHVTSGEVPPPANPLVVSQPCIRLNDLANIGRSGRHFSCFEMMGHHAFNSKAWGEKYWTEECVAYGVEFLTKILGLDGKRITFKESTWNGGGNAGPCVEVFAGGLEVATLVFMCLEEHESGTFTIKGDKYRMMDLRIIDTGWGLERLAWASTGTPTAYDTVFPETLAHLRSLATVAVADDERSRRIVTEHARVQGILNLDIGQKLDALRAEVVGRLAGHGLKTDVAELERIMAPVESLYALADHLRCLSFMVGDGIVPSNVKAGYLMRLVTRRALRFKDALGIRASLGDLLAWNMERMLGEFPEFKDAIPRAKEIAELETERAKESTERGLRLVERMLQKKRSLSTDDLVELYDTHGLGPYTVAEAAAKVGVPVQVPDDFDMIVAARHSKGSKERESRLPIPATVPATRRIFYEDQDRRSFDATVTWAGRHGDHHAVLLSETCFFHETGGQPGDQGTLRLADGSTVRVFNTTKDGDHPVHHVEKPLPAGAKIHGEVDWDLRMDHTRSHTATHIMNQSVRRVLGAHSWQAGTQKYADCARVDMTHFRRPSRDELHAIERLANQVVMESRPVTRTWMKRDEAERKYGMTLLQGGIPKGRDVRVVQIGPAAGEPKDSYFDVEYCGGTHCHTTAEVGPVKLYRTERVQDGVERFEYAAGLHAVAKWQAVDEALRTAGEAIEVQPGEVPKAAARFFSEWKEQRKAIESMQARLAELESKAAAGAAETVNGVRLAVSVLPAAALQKTAKELVSQVSTIALLGAKTERGSNFVFARSADLTHIDLKGLLLQPAFLALIGQGGGGGKPDFVQVGGNDGSRVSEALSVVKGIVVGALA